MNKKFTKEDIIKKRETNIKSAQTVLILAGVLGFIHIVQFLFSQKNGFYFSFALPAFMFDLFSAKTISAAVAWGVTAVFLLLYLAFFLLGGKSTKWLRASLALYLADFAFCLYRIFIFYGAAATEELYISLAMHLFIIVFLVVGNVSARKQKDM